MNNKIWLWTMIGALLVAPSCHNAQLESPLKANLTAENWVEQTLQQMSLREKIGQMILMNFNARYIHENSPEWQRIQHDIKNNCVFGYHLWGGDAFAVRHYVKKMQAIAKIPLIFSADFERGAGFLVRGAVTFPTNMAFGATRNFDFAYQFGKYTALESRALGITQLFTPVVDVNNNPNNPIINTRSFGETPALVSGMANAYIKGCQAHGAAAAVKHFPGHGDTDSDSHLDLPVIDAGRQRLQAVELPPFRRTIDQGVYTLMSAHIYIPALVSTPGVPATLSSEILTDLLRKKWEFDGVVYTDAMGMGGITHNFTVAYAFVKAIQAGCDVLTNTDNHSVDSLINIITAAVIRGELSRARIDQSVRRILTLKARLNLPQAPLADMDQLNSQLAPEKSKQFSREVAQAAITLARDSLHLIPLPYKIKNAHVISLYDEPKRLTNNTFQREISRYIPGARTHLFDGSDDMDKFRPILDSLSAESFVILGAFMRYRAFKGYIDMPPAHTELIHQIHQKTDRLAVISFGNPYILRQFPQIGTYVCSFGWESVMQRAAVKALFGEISIQGRMPVTIPGLVAFGHGIQRGPTRGIRRPSPSAPQPPILKRGFAYEVSMHSDSLAKLDSLLHYGIRDSAYPGCTFLAAKEGVIFHEKALGKLSYAPDSPSVTLGTIYDLASLSKVIGTTSAAMWLYDQGLLQLNHPVAEVLPEFGQNGKDKVTFHHLLTHSSGLPAWHKLWETAATPQAMLQTIYQMELQYEPGTQTIYSCLGFIVLGKALEKLAEQPLDQLLQEQIFAPLGMAHTGYNPPQKYQERIAPTEYDSARGGIVHGRVHDENAYYLGGVSGNAGLFSTVQDLAIFCQMMLNKGVYDQQRIFKTKTVEKFTRRQNLVAGSSRALGWDTPGGESSSGHYFSGKAYGHTGFTGTSLWIDPQKALFGIWLTNRVHPTRENHKLYRFRYQVYDQLQQAVQDHILTKNPNVYQQKAP